MVFLTHRAAVGALVAVLGAGGALAQPREVLRIVGTGSGASILQAVADAFEASHPGAVVEVPPSIGSTGGVREVGVGREVLGRVSRPLTEEERSYGLTWVPYAKNPVVFCAHPGVPVEDLSPEQLCAVYSGAVTNWQALGGPDLPIRVVRREEGDSSYAILRRFLPGFASVRVLSRARTAYSDPETLQVVADTPGAIAFGAWGDARRAGLKVLTVAGRSPADPDYPYAGTLALVFRPEHYEGALRALVEFATSPEAREALRRAGARPCGAPGRRKGGRQP
ncbi:MAG: substrate-binding domain-containing protein [Deferrisomatales bacterium]